MTERSEGKQRPGGFSEVAPSIAREATAPHDVPNRYGRTAEELEEARARIADARRRAEKGLIRDDPIGGRLKTEEDRRRLAAQ